MDDFAAVFSILIFLLYAIIAGGFIVAAIRMWAWPFIKGRLPARPSQAQNRPLPPADGEKSASQP